MKQRGLERAWALGLNVVFHQTLPGLCFADHSVCWKHAKKGKKISDQLVSSYLFPHLITASARLSNLSVPSGCGASTAALTESHMKPNVSVWERTKPAAPTHTSLRGSLKELLYSPTRSGAKPSAVPITSSLSSPESVVLLARLSDTVVSEQGV